MAKLSDRSKLIMIESLLTWQSENLIDTFKVLDEIRSVIKTGKPKGDE